MFSLRNELRWRSTAAWQYAINHWLPGRPTVEPGGRAALRAKYEGHTRNILVREGARVREGAWLTCADAASSIEIGSGTLIMPWAKLMAVGGRIEIGRNCSMHSFDVFYGFAGGLKIGDNVRIGVHVCLIPSNHLFDDLAQPMGEQGASSLGIVIEDDVWIGAGVRVLDGVRVGRGAVLGAGAVVTRDVPPNAVAVGVPARCIRQRGGKLSSGASDGIA
jgi:acetyltransferase-like isoleucine patch superfamily enzyme